MSDDRYNASLLQTLTVAFLTSTAQLAALPGNIAVAAELSGLDKDAVVDVTQVRTLDRTALGECVGQLPPWLMTQVDDGLRRALAL